jgi:hypothetical protein
MGKKQIQVVNTQVELDIEGPVGFLEDKNQCFN